MKNAMMGDKAQPPRAPGLLIIVVIDRSSYVHDEIKLQDRRRGIEHSLETNIKILSPQINKVCSRYSGSRIDISCDSCVLTYGIFSP